MLILRHQIYSKMLHENTGAIKSRFEEIGGGECGEKEIKVDSF